MAKTKKKGSGPKATSMREQSRANAAAKASIKSESRESPEELYNTAISLAEQSQPNEALKYAQKLWSLVQTGPVQETLPALNLLGEISLELGDGDAARAYFEQAATRDPNGDVEGPLGGGAEKFLWLAQLSEKGGKQSVTWFEKGVQALQREITFLEGDQDVGLDPEAVVVMRVEKKRKLANALCGIVEVYMTDLSWDEDAESRCESTITHALTVEDETSPEVLQTLASVRLSQDRKEDAQSALKRSYESWKDLDADDEAIPEFAARISLARLLMEAEMESEALDVLDRLILEDDQSIEAWYLGGWCQFLISESVKNGRVSGPADVERPETSSDVDVTMRSSRRWLNMALKLYKQLDYEDDRLRDHAEELVSGLDATLGPEEENERGDESEEEWDGVDDIDDEEAPQDQEMKDV